MMNPFLLWQELNYDEGRSILVHHHTESEVDWAQDMIVTYVPRSESRWQDSIADTWISCSEVASES